MNRILLSISIVALVVGSASAQKIDDAIKKVEAVFEPAEAKPGQTVTLKIIVQLADGYHTYPVVQPSPEAKYSVNTIALPKDGPVIFVGDTVDPVSPKSKKVDDYELLEYPGGGTWIRKAVVAPSAKAGAIKTKIKLKLLVCDENNCFPPKTYDLEASLKVLDGPPVAIDPKYKNEVEKSARK